MLSGGLQGAKSEALGRERLMKVAMVHEFEDKELGMKEWLEAEARM